MAVERLGVGGGELEDVDSFRKTDCVSKDGVHQDGRRTELGVAAFVGEELNGSLIVVFSGYIGIFSAIISKPLLHSTNQLQPNTHSPAIEDPINKFNAILYYNPKGENKLKGSYLRGNNEMWGSVCKALENGS